LNGLSVFLSCSSRGKEPVVPAGRDDPWNRLRARPPEVVAIASGGMFSGRERRFAGRGQCVARGRYASAQIPCSRAHLLLMIASGRKAGWRCRSAALAPKRRGPEAGCLGTADPGACNSDNDRLLPQARARRPDTRRPKKTVRDWGCRGGRDELGGRVIARRTNSPPTLPRTSACRSACQLSRVNKNRGFRCPRSRQALCVTTSRRLPSPTTRPPFGSPSTRNSIGRARSAALCCWAFSTRALVRGHGAGQQSSPRGRRMPAYHHTSRSIRSPCIGSWGFPLAVPQSSNRERRRSGASHPL